LEKGGENTKWNKMGVGVLLWDEMVRHMLKLAKLRSVFISGWTDD
jgi:hypothetical protein